MGVLSGVSSGTVQMAQVSFGEGNVECTLCLVRGDSEDRLSIGTLFGADLVTILAQVTRTVAALPHTSISERKLRAAVAQIRSRT